MVPALTKLHSSHPVESTPTKTRFNSNIRLAPSREILARVGVVANCSNQLKNDEMISFERIALMVASMSPWWLVAIALVLIMTELLIVGTSETSLIVGFALLLVAALNAIGASGYFQVCAFPAGLLIAYLGQRKFYRAITNKGEGYESLYGKRNYVGKKGVLTVKESKNESEDYFYDYKKSMPLEVSHPVSVVKVTRVLVEGTGEVLPAMDETGLLKDGQVVLIVAENNGALVVKSQES